MVAVALAVTSCASGSVKAASSTSPRTATSPAVSVGPACAAPALSLQQDQGPPRLGFPSAGGHSMTYFVITNTGAKLCTVGGYPGVRVFQQAGGEVRLQLIDGNSYMIPDPGPRRVALERGDSAYFGFTWNDSPVPRSASTVPCPRATRVQALIGTAVLTTRGDLLRFCGPLAWVTALAGRAAFTGPNPP